MSYAAVFKHIFMTPSATKPSRALSLQISFVRPQTQSSHLGLICHYPILLVVLLSQMPSELISLDLVWM